MLHAAHYVRAEEQIELSAATKPLLDAHRRMCEAAGVTAVDMDRSLTCSALQTVLSASDLSSLHQLMVLASTVATIAAQSPAPRTCAVLFVKMLESAVDEVSAALAPKGSA